MFKINLRLFSCSACTGCSGCGSGCAGSCTGCSGTCEGGCTNCTGGCTACTGSCTGGCDTGCTATNMAEFIASLGKNIMFSNMASAQDILDLKAQIDKELTRRSRAASITAYTVAPASGGYVMAEHTSKIIAECKAMDSTKTWAIGADNIVRASDLKDAAVYIQTLASQILKA